MSDDIKNLSVFSLIFGAASGIAALVPFLGVLMFLMIIFCSSFVIITLMKRSGYLVCPNEQMGLAYGGLSGFMTFIGFAITFLPMSLIFSFIFKESYFTGIAMILKSGFTLGFTLILFIAILCAMMNSFSGLASIYFFNSGKSEKTQKFSLDLGKLKNLKISKKGKNNGF